MRFLQCKRDDGHVGNSVKNCHILFRVVINKAVYADSSRRKRPRAKNGFVRQRTAVSHVVFTIISHQGTHPGPRTQTRADKLRLDNENREEVLSTKVTRLRRASIRATSTSGPSLSDNLASWQISVLLGITSDNFRCYDKRSIYCYRHGERFLLRALPRNRT